MPGNEQQERFEDYLELERYIEGLQKGKPVHPPCDLAPNQVRIYRMAALFRSVDSAASEPDPEFVANLHDHLLSLNELDGNAASEAPTAQPAKPPIVEAPGQEQEIEQPAAEQAPQAIPRRRRVRASLSRRSLLTGGAVAAASLAAGVGLGAALINSKGNDTPPSTQISPYWSSPLVPSGPEGVPTTWHFVTTQRQLGSQAVQFNTGAVIGYVILSDDDDPYATGNQSSPSVIALSAACTHMGCTVQWNADDRQFHCPCHGGTFTEYGAPNNQVSADSKEQPLYLAALPRLTVKVDKDGNIMVQVPKLK